MLSKVVVAKAAAVAVVIMGAGSAAAAATANGGDTAKSVASTRTPISPSGKPATTSAAPHIPAPTVSSGRSLRRGNGPNIHALPGLCRAQIASAGHPNAHSVIPSINCAGVTPAGPTTPAPSSTSPGPAGPSTSDGTQDDGSQGGDATGSGHGRH